MRKNCIRTLIAAVLIASTMTATAFADTAVVTGSEVNVRSGPGSDYAILGSYGRGSTVQVLDRSNPAWYTVDYFGEIGFMSSAYLRLEETGGSAVIVSDSAAQASPGQAVLSTPAQTTMRPNAQITGMYVRFRSGPSGSSAILGEYNNGKAITVLGTEGDWTLCYIDGQYGYIFSSYVSAAAPAVNATPAPAADTASPVIVFQDSGSAPVTPAPAAPVPGSGHGVILDGSSSGVAVTPIPVPPAVTPTMIPAIVTPTPAPAAGNVSLSGTPGVIVGDYVRFRRGPGTGYSIITSYDNGQDITVIATEGEWTYCQIEGKTGYVFSQYVRTGALEPSAPAVLIGGQTVTDPAFSGQVPLAATPAPTGAVGSPGYIRGNNVRFRAGPDLSSEILRELFYGNAVTITGSDGTWSSIVYEGQAGYVFSQYVQAGTFQTVSSGGSATGREIADYALQYLGTPYRWGGVDPGTGFDCSGFVYYVYRHFGYTLNRVASEQALNGKHVDTSDLQPGDLLCFYSGGSYIGHVGLYIGNNMFVHAASSTTGVITSELTGYYAKRGFEARRIIG